MDYCFLRGGLGNYHQKKKKPTQADPKKLFLAQKKIAQPPRPFLKNNGHFLNRALTLTESKGK